MKIELNSYDLGIKTLDDGTEVVQIQNRLAFNEEFITEMKASGVSKIVKTEEESENEEE